MEENEDTCRQMMDTNPASAGNSDGDNQCYDGTLPKDGLKDGSMESKGTEDGAPKATFGCQHYKRKCKLFAPCCGRAYTCRFCHNDVENHCLDRRQVMEVVCMQCKTQQPVQKNCQQCNLEFGRYYCAQCKLFDDDDKQQYHCEGCGICRIGGRERFFHCTVCDMCLPMRLQGNHKCVERVSRTNCPVCLEDIHTSRIPSHIPPCGHLIHRTCFGDMLKSGLYACPVCNTSMINMEKVWQHLDEEIQETPMPDDYRNLFVMILCRDCHKESEVAFHILGLKCQECGSYNTCRNKGKAVLRVPVVDPKCPELVKTGLVSYASRRGKGKAHPLGAVSFDLESGQGQGDPDLTNLHVDDPSDPIDQNHGTLLEAY
ncbi:unnamed protein product [Darwinula stevensoni]|uniref:RING finger and CHY zinc finger domain-containing protein 1 n=1 Tax=Darwinula stevensoni TaxID=69355 RepID=A0A7R8ZYY5_9CRUS|nr:unnamed protein product [Darwinula stevensoni]CAG0882425.1 unnamed protein product [Darwinula stevensoni]